ncbi:MAG: glycosyltransferase family 2 protein, partial [Candidatus Omnitrophica bacterium]|nr:glycosyltransferase family 2 protein [Candidatus Omnitrophota bacterium]
MRETLFSLVAPVFNEEKNIGSFYCQAASALNSLQGKYEIVFVDDASCDGSLPALREIAAKDNRVRVVSLKERRGQQVAYLAGLVQAKGRYIITADSDLQYDLKEIPLMVGRLIRGCDAVAGKRIMRKDPAYRKIASLLLNKIMDLRIGRHIDDWGCSFCALDRRLLFKILSLGRNARFLKPAAVLMAKRIEQVEVNHFCRNGVSRYSFLGL